MTDKPEHAERYKIAMAKFWERICNKEPGTFVGMYRMVPVFQVDEIKTTPKA